MQVTRLNPTIDATSIEYNGSKELTMFEVDFGAAVNTKTGPESTIAKVVDKVSSIATVVIRGDLHSTNQVMTFAVEQDNSTTDYDGSNQETLVAHIEDEIQAMGTVDGINLASASATVKTSFNLA